ncbi:MAG: hypothetical protein GW780_05500, partial [Candidatus Aenigmarchaeota archaeon]|nr:hypothetical protein [Candidatus Aenigmarchaeota archaeon]
VIAISNIGKATTITLNFNNYRIIDLLVEMELKKKEKFLEKAVEMQMIFLDMEKLLKNLDSIDSALIINPQHNLKSNRLEFMFLLKNTINPEEVLSIIEELQRRHSIAIDSLILTEEEFLKLINSEEANPAKEMLWNKIAFFSPQNLWIMIKLALAKNLKIKTEREETNPAKISEIDLACNLSRFGYREMGLKIEKGKEICPEYIITSILLQNNARRIYAIPVILMKNKISYEMLIFLAKKYKKASELLGILKTLNKIKKNEKLENAIRILEKIGVKGTIFSYESIKEKMRLYNAI